VDKISEGDRKYHRQCARTVASKFLVGGDKVLTVEGRESR
jgi:hypothetical protein